ncbi:patatin-like phospholipase family protein [Actinomadura darangshiensis]|uniref:Patatin-like phospholipase family protein n=1 Tax=Actinomadura darangshiensis TaxID=705336 RepID=A0A4V2YQK6_9ACTN|nr:patatin-like phospholipase family protein [Actinomadura darangshiensis]TDD62437.1 patatin-like phospholipase family protein [Actinomadura darangshiensis]
MVEREPRVAFVLGGGGVLGAHEVGMLRALEETGVRPDLVVGTSIGALNGVFVAADPAAAVERLTSLWSDDSVREVFGARVWSRLWTLARSGTHLHSNEPLRRMLDELLPVPSFEELDVPYQCVAAGIETAMAHWFTEGPLIPAVLASSAAPGLLPPVRIGDRHYFDGGLVHSIPVGRAVMLGATTIYVLHVGRIERALAPPRRPWEVGLVSFEIARRHRFFEEMATLPDGLTVHVLPAGGKSQKAGVDLAQMRYKNVSGIQAHIERAYQASLRYLKERS